MSGHQLVFAAILLLAGASSCLATTDGDDATLTKQLQEQIQFHQEQMAVCEHLHHEHDKNKGIFFRDCDDAYELGGARASGVYFIQPDDDEPFQVYCDMDTDGGGWTVFQRRKDGSVNFNRDWVDYEQGFGDLTGEFWLGLNKTHRITAISPAAADNELRIDLEDFDQNSRYAKYGLFAIRDSAAIYRLTVSKYSGTAGDSLAWFHNGLLYSTKDQDNDPCYTCSCSLSYKGAWWYAVCHQSNLNGEYLGGQHSLYARGIVWNSWRGYQYSLKFTEMKVRRQ